MPARDFPNLGLKGGYDEHESGWADDMNANLLKLSALAQATVISKVNATPGSPTSGDVYLFGATHPTQANKIAIYEGPSGSEAWTYVTPAEGWLVYNRAADYYEKFDGTVWAELATGGGGGGGVEEAPEDGNPYARQDAGWVPVMGGGGGAGPTILEQVQLKIARESVPLAVNTGYDFVINNGELVALYYTRYAVGNSYVGAASSYTVPTGKVAVLIEAYPTRNTKNDTAFYKHRLYNEDTSTIVVAASDFIVSENGFVHADTNTTVNATFDPRYVVGVAGQTLRAYAGGGSDSISRSVTCVYILAIVDS